MSGLFNPAIVDSKQRARAIARVRELGVVLPTLTQLANPASIPAEASEKLREVAPDEPRIENLWRVNWYNAADRKRAAEVPGFIVIPESISGVEAPIVVLLGCRFPMIGAHKVLPAYGSGLAAGVGALRSGHSEGDLAFDRKLLPGRRVDLAHSGLPRCCRAAGGDEPRAVRLAGAMGGPSR